MGTLDPRNERATARPITDFVGASGRTWPVYGPKFWPDAARKAADNDDDETAIRLIVTDEAYDDFVAAEGTAVMLWEHIMSELGDSVGVPTPGESGGSENSSTGSGAEPSSPSLPESTGSTYTPS